MSKRPVVSIVIPVYNLQNYIEDCINSILKQASGEIEIIVVNDGSTDGSDLICNSFASNVVVTILHQKNQGVSVARNNGLKVAKGEYVYFVDGDDLLAPDSIENILNKIKATKADIISGNYVKFIDSNKIPSTQSVSMETIKAVESLSGHAALAGLIEHSIFLPNVSTSVVKRNLFTRNNIKFEVGVSNTEDLNCGMQLYLVANKVAVLQDTIYFYRQSRLDSLSSTRSRKGIEDSMAFIKAWILKIKKLDETDTAKAWLLDYIAYQYLIVLGAAYTFQKRDRKYIMRNIATSKWLLASRLSKKTRYVGAFYDIFGLTATGMFLSLIIQMKSINSQSLVRHIYLGSKVKHNDI